MNLNEYYKRIEELEYSMEKIDGKKPIYSLNNRLFGCRCVLELCFINYRLNAIFL